ncbi:MAG: RtcB family protein [Spirochaetes bacterium]|nr:RtcB family protein [Spirochaetota bacterium]MBN2771287.1 RtcB family protein [Spirochaetota bacterium]
MNSKISIIASSTSWIESSAIDQMEALARLKGVEYMIGLPDLHPGRGIPVGAVCIAKDIIYPHIIGNDIGCGMSLFKTNIRSSKFSTNRIADKLEKNIGNENAGSIGGGNHFAEFLIVESIDDQMVKDTLIDTKSIYLLVHSGSRGYGNMIYNHYLREHNAHHGFETGSELCTNYLKDHDDACIKASENRANIALDICHNSGINLEEKPVIESTHNYVEMLTIENCEYIIHRKGASSALCNYSVIPGSRGDFSHIIKPVNAGIKSGFSLPHGAGRKWNRNQCKDRLLNKYTKESIKRTKLGSRVVSANSDILFEEAPEAYKKITEVIGDMEKAELLQKYVLKN